MPGLKYKVDFILFYFIIIFLATCIGKLAFGLSRGSSSANSVGVTSLNDGLIEKGTFSLIIVMKIEICFICLIY